MMKNKVMKNRYVRCGTFIMYFSLILFCCCMSACNPVDPILDPYSIQFKYQIQMSGYVSVFYLISVVGDINIDNFYKK
jgi:hypothetical protein